MTGVSAAARWRESVSARSRWLRGDLGMTFAGWLVVVFVGLGTGLIALQLLLSDHLIPSIATIFFGVGIALTGFKVHRSAVSSARLLREHRREAVRVRALLVELREGLQAPQVDRSSEPITVQIAEKQPSRMPMNAAGRPPARQVEAQSKSAKVQPDSHDRQPARSSPSVGARLGAVEPSTVKVIDRGSKGRQAGAVTNDEARPWKLFSATLGMGSALLEPGRRTLRPIAGVVSPELLKVITGTYAFTQFHPGLVPVELDYAQPTAIVLEESALDRGVWFGALRTAGAPLFADISAALIWAKAKCQSIFVLPDSTPKPYSVALRQQASYVVRPGLVATGVQLDASVPLLECLREYVSSAAVQTTGSVSEVGLDN